MSLPNNKGRTIFTILGIVLIAIAIVSLIGIPISLAEYGWDAAIFFLLVAWFCFWSAGKLFIG